jgi:hypothetical protein
MISFILAFSATSTGFGCRRSAIETPSHRKRSSTDC